MFNHALLYAIALLTGRYVFAHLASLINYRAGNSIVSKIKKELYPKLLNNSQTDSISSALLVTRVSDDLKTFFSFFIPYAIASALVGIFFKLYFMARNMGGNPASCFHFRYSVFNENGRCKCDITS